MAGYKCVNFGDLCRLCASSSGGRVGIFTDEGKRKNIHVKITDCLKIKIYEKDRLPKSVCSKCLKQLEAHVEFRESVVKAQGMLESCLNSTKLRNGGMVYIKDDSTKDDLPTTSPQASISSSPSTATITLPTLQTQPPAAQAASPQVKLLPTIPASSSTLQQQQPTATITTAPAMTPIIINSLPKGFGQGTTAGTATIMAPNADFLTSIMQAVGIQTGETSVAAAAVAAAASTQDTSGQNQQQQQPLAQYTITVDGQTIKANQIHYKIQDGTTGGQGSVLAIDGEQQQQGSSYQAQMDEFLKLKTPAKSASRKELEKTSEPVSAKKPKISVLIKPPQTPQTTLVTSTPPKQTILAATTPMATAISSSPITLTPVSSTTSIASFSAAPTGTIFTSTPLAANSATVKSTAAIPVLDAAKMMQGNKCIVPIMLKAEGGGEQIALAPIANVGEMNKSMVSNVQYVQMKLQPGPDGMFRLAPAQMPPALTLTPQGLQQFGISPIQTVQTQPAQQQIQIQPQQIQAQLTMPSVQVPLSNYLSLVEKSTQLQNQTSEVQQPQQANIVITTQPVQQQSQQQQQTTVQQTQHLQVVQRPTIQVQQAAQQTPPKAPKPNPPQPSQSSPITHRRESSQDHHSQLNSSSESLTSATNASLAATQQMKAISALSLLKQDTHHDSMVGGSTSQGNIASSVSSTVSFTSCDVCSKSFKRKEHLMQHLKSHVGLRPFKCDETGCSKSFSRKEHLMRHIVSHTGKKLFACPICRKYFSRKDNLNKHKKTHQQNSSSAPYHCTICSKHFYIKGHFLKHKQMHDMAKDAQQSEKKSPVKPKAESSERSQQLPTVQQQQQSQQQQQQQQPQHQIQQVQLPTQQQVQPQPQIQPATIQSQQIFTIPAAQLQSALSGKGPILQQLQIAMPTSMATATSHHSTLQTVSASTLAGLGVGGATVTASSTGANSGGTRTAIIKSADGSSATVYTLPSNFIIDGTQFLSAMQQQQQQQQSRELMGSIGNIKIEQIT